MPTSIHAQRRIEAAEVRHAESKRRLQAANLRREQAAKTFQAAMNDYDAVVAAYEITAIALNRAYGKRS